MESAGLAVGVAGLAGLFSACVDCFEYIQLGQQFGQDYGRCLLKLDMARLQLSRWGAAIGLDTVHSGLQKEEVAHNTMQEKRLAENLLKEILYIFEEIERVSARYTGPHADNANISPEYQRAHFTMRELAQQRQKTTSVRKKARWALYEKKKFDRMIEDLTGFINQLVELYPAGQDDQRALCKAEVAAFPRAQDLALLNDIAHGDDRILCDEIEREMKNRGHVVTDWVADKDSKLWAGDDNAYGVKAQGHTFARFSVSGNAEVHLGNNNKGARSRD